MGQQNDSLEVTKVTEQERVEVIERNMTCVKECQEEMEMDEEGTTGEGETVDDDGSVPVVQARLNVDIMGALTRQKIASVQRGRTLSYVDREDSEESPTRRSRPFAHNRDSMDIEGPPPKSFSKDSTVSLPPKTERNIKVCRNPSYHSAVTHAAVNTPQKIVKPETMDLQTSGSSSEGCPTGHEPLCVNPSSVEEMSPSQNSPRLELPKLEKNRPLDLPVAANMPRSASFSDGGLLQCSPPANGSLQEAYGRRGSISQPSTPVTKRSQAPVSVPKETASSNSSIPVRGSVLTRSFKRLFSTPVRLSPNPSTPTEEYWPDLPDEGEPGTPTPSSDSRPTSRLRKLSTTLTRKLSTRSKMSHSQSFPTGTNGHQQIMANGETLPDSSTLVDYEALMKLFVCSGCQTIMAPPLHQCRKGHLVCGTCRSSLKQACPVCKQRFAETTNMMMEQVCNLVKFPCRWSNSGCPEFHSPRSRLDHEHFCIYRPLHCHHASKGCQKVLIMRDMHQHVEVCEFKDK